MTTREIVERVILGIMGLSISVASFFVKWQLADLNETIKSSWAITHQLQIDTALLAKDTQLHRDWLQSYQGRLAYVEARTERFNVYLENHPTRKN